MTNDPAEQGRRLAVVGLNVTLLPPEPAEAVEALATVLARRAAGALDDAAYGQALRTIAGRWPAFLDAWARLGELAYAQGKDVDAYAFFRVGYHRGLDRLRQNGWRGTGQIPWSHEPNRGFLRSLHGLMIASAALGDGAEARRCRQFLLDSDPSDPFDVGSLDPARLDQRVERSDRQQEREKGQPSL